MISGSSERHVRAGSRLALLCRVERASAQPSFVYWWGIEYLALLTTKQEWQFWGFLDKKPCTARLFPLSCIGVISFCVLHTVRISSTVILTLFTQALKRAAFAFGPAVVVPPCFCFWSTFKSGKIVVGSKQANILFLECSTQFCFFVRRYRDGDVVNYSDRPGISIATGAEAAKKWENDGEGFLCVLVQRQELNTKSRKSKLANLAVFLSFFLLDNLIYQQKNILFVQICLQIRLPSFLRWGQQGGQDKESAEAAEEREEIAAGEDTFNNNWRVFSIVFSYLGGPPSHYIFISVWNIWLAVDRQVWDIVQEMVPVVDVGGECTFWQPKWPCSSKL